MNDGRIIEVETLACFTKIVEECNKAVTEGLLDKEELKPIKKLLVYVIKLLDSAAIPVDKKRNPLPSKIKRDGIRTHSSFSLQICYVNHSFVLA